MAWARSGCWGLKSISCTMLLFSCTSGEGDEFCGLTANATILTVVWVFAAGTQSGVAACAASSPKGANARPVMSGVTRQRFQNSAVNKVKVSRFAGRRFVFMSWTVHG